MPEVKTRQNQGKPVLNTAQQQMQRSFVKARQEQAAQKQNEQSESPNSYAEEKISRTAENAVWDRASLAVREIRSLRQRNSEDEKYGVSPESDIPEEHQQPSADNPIVPASESARSRPATRQEASEVFNANPVRARSYPDSGAYPKFSGCVFGMQWFQQRGLWLDSSTEPMPGMLIFFDWAPQDGVPDHVGIVEKVENGMVYTVEGNSRDMCRQKQYSLGSGVILGYGMAAD